MEFNLQASKKEANSQKPGKEIQLAITLLKFSSKFWCPSCWCQTRATHLKTAQLSCILNPGTKAGFGCWSLLSLTAIS